MPVTKGAVNVSCFGQTRFCYMDKIFHSKVADAPCVVQQLRLHLKLQSPPRAIHQGRLIGASDDERGNSRGCMADKLVVRGFLVCSN